MDFFNKIKQFIDSRYFVPYTCDLYIGVPGAGKSTLAAYFAKKDLKHNYPVYSNVAIKGAYVLDPKTDIGHVDISNGRVILDEIGLCFNNRNWKSNLSDPQMDWLKKHRHNRVHIDCFSQGLDFDNRFLSLASRVYIVRKSLLPKFVKYTLIYKRIGVNDETHTLEDGYYKVFPLFSTKRIFAPLVWKMFDSYEVTPLPSKEWTKY